MEIASFEDIFTTTASSAMFHAANVDLETFKKQFAEVEAYLSKQMKR